MLDRILNISRVLNMAGLQNVLNKTLHYRYYRYLIESWICLYSLETESTAHFFLRCRNYTDVRITLMNESYKIDNSITSRQPNELLRIILYGDCKFKDNVNKQILIATIHFIKNSNRFNQSLIYLACKNNIQNYT